MPNSRFQWVSLNTSVATVDNLGKTSARSNGFTMIRVHDTDMSESDADVELQVVSPSVVIITALEGDSWTWSTNQKYDVEVAAADSNGRRLALVDAVQLSLTTTGDGTCLSLEQLPNVVKVGRPILSHRYRISTHCIGSASLVGTFSHSVSRPLWTAIQTTQDIIIHAAVTVRPSTVMLPWHPSMSHSLLLVASGGSGLYDWRSDSADVSVSENGMISCRSLGRAMIQASDKRNPRNRAVVPVTVAEISALRIVGMFIYVSQKCMS